jgi:hypothetical protein
MGERAHELPIGRARSSGGAPLSSTEYLERHQLAGFLRDVTALVLRARDERPLEALAAYFGEVRDGTHTLLREFGDVSRYRDACAFLANAQEALSDLDQATPMSANHFTQLLRLVCPDFPLDVVADACRYCEQQSGDEYPLRVLLQAVAARMGVLEPAHGAEHARTRSPHDVVHLERLTRGLRAAQQPKDRIAPPRLREELGDVCGDVTSPELLDLISRAESMYSR